MVQIHRFLLLSVVLSVVTSGLATTSLAATLDVEPVLSGLNGPVRLVAPDGDARLFVVERRGVIKVFDQDGTARSTFLDISSMTTTTSERGLLGLAFAPDYASSGRFYISYTDLDGNSQIARYSVSADPDVADAASGEVILSLVQPFANHNGGHIEFGPDGMLYIGFGDGGSAGDPNNHAQDDGTLLGKMLRIDVSGASGYTVPADNPNVGSSSGALPEIWAKGLRNPWCFSFDPMTGDLYIADVGQNVVEEIDVQPAASVGGENYGWRLMEGSNCFNPASNCNDGSLVLPVYEYNHGGTPFRCSITGGYVYRGSAIPSLQGAFLFADYCSKQVWTFRWDGGSGGTVTEVTAEVTPAQPYLSLASFGRDGLGELYILDISRGTVHRIVPAVGTPVRSGSMGGMKGRW